MSLRAMIHQTNSGSKQERLVVSGAVIAIAIGAFVFLTLPFFLGYFGPSVPLTEQTLNSLSFNSLPSYKVSIHSDATFDTGSSETITRIVNHISLGTYTTAHFGMLNVGKRFLMVKTFGEIDENITDYSGYLVPSNADQIGRQVLRDILDEFPEMSESSLSFMLDANNAPWPWVAGLIVEGLLVVWALSYLRKLPTYNNLNNHPIMKTLARFGDSDAIVNEIDDEILHGEPIQVGYLQFTQSWLIYQMGKAMEFARLKDVMWIYKSVTSYGGNKAYSVYIWDRSGEMFCIVGRNERHADAMMDAAIQQAPWAITGHTPEREKAWQNNRTRFAQIVDDRRAQGIIPQ